MTKQFQLGESSLVAIVEGDFPEAAPVFVISHEQIKAGPGEGQLFYETVRDFARDLAKKLGLKEIILLFSRSFLDVTMGVIDGFFDAGVLVEVYDRDMGSGDLVLKIRRVPPKPTATHPPEYGVFQPNESSN